MPRLEQPSYTDLVFEILRSAERPLTFQEIFDGVNGRKPAATSNPKATIRGALTQARQLVSTGDGRYGYLPHLVTGSLLRVPFTEKKPANHPLVYPEEARIALWPAFFDASKRTDRRPARIRLSDGVEVELTLEYLGPRLWASPMPDGLHRFLAENHANEGTSLLIRVIDGETGRYEASLESGLKRDTAAVSGRNQELAGVFYHLLRKHREREAPIWDLALAALARGFYRAVVPPDPLETVLKADPRFQDAGFHSWILSENVTPEEMRALFRGRQELDADLNRTTLAPSFDKEQAPSAQSTRRSLGQSLADVGSILSQREFGSLDEANALLKEILAQGGIRHRQGHDSAGKGAGSNVRGVGGL
ncbi:MAG: hypothetical protein Q7O66_02865 [Dehalococcoidia bacterium]|nr:hypothetical protein [Dehalococcoidia bacterium]